MISIILHIKLNIRGDSFFIKQQQVLVKAPIATTPLTLLNMNGGAYRGSRVPGA